MKKRILFVHHHAGLSGASNSLFILLNSIDKKKYECEVLINQEKGSFIDKCKEINIKITYSNDILVYGHCNGGKLGVLGYPPFKSITRLFKVPKSIRNLKDYIQKNRYDLVYVNSSVLWTAAVAGRQVNTKTIIHVREIISNYGLLKLRKTLFRAILEKYSNHIIVISRTSEKQFKNKSKVSVIYNAVDEKKYNIDKLGDKNSIKSLGLGDRPHLIFLGGVQPHKGLLDLLRAMPEIIKEKPLTKLLILGNTDTPYVATNNIAKRVIRKLFLKDNSKSFENLVDKLDIREKLDVVGPQINVEEWIARADLVIFPNTVDHFGRPIIEGLSIGSKVIAADHASNRELYDIFSDTGLIRLVKTRRASELSDAIIQGLKNQIKELPIEIIKTKFKEKGFYSNDQSRRINKVIILALEKGR